MKRLALTAVAGILVVACQDLGTTPTPVKDFEVEHAFTGGSLNPPPPPIDSGAVGVADAADSDDGASVVFRISYMLNKPENSGWLKFNKDEYSNTDVDNSAAIKLTNGVYSGKGIIRIQGDDGGTFVLDLSKVDYLTEKPVFEECAATREATTTDPRVCFSLNLSSGLTYFAEGSTKGTAARLSLNPGPTTGTDVCENEIGSECIITIGQ